MIQWWSFLACLPHSRLPPSMPRLAPVSSVLQVGVVLLVLTEPTDCIWSAQFQLRRITRCGCGRGTHPHTLLALQMGEDAILGRNRGSSRPEREEPLPQLLVTSRQVALLIGAVGVPAAPVAIFVVSHRFLPSRSRSCTATLPGLQWSRSTRVPNQRGQPGAITTPSSMHRHREDSPPPCNPRRHEPLVSMWGNLSFLMLEVSH